jgi:hypothetical protein
MLDCVPARFKDFGWFVQAKCLAQLGQRLDSDSADDFDWAVLHQEMDAVQAGRVSFLRSRKHIYHVRTATDAHPQPVPHISSICLDAKIMLKK